MQDIALDLHSESLTGRRNLYVVKLVSFELSGRLPNFRIEQLEDIKGLPEFFLRNEDTNYVEVWYCRTRVDEDVFSVAGRFVFADEGNARTQSVEQVWRCSPRLLEYYTPNFDYPYVRASRYSWNWRYSVEHVRMPKKLGIDRSDLMREFYESMRMFEREREQISTFLSFLDSFGFRAYSIEYKIVGSRLNVIDWDTPDDRKVIALREPRSR